jgi:Domain of unknown function (DUF6265)
MRRILALVFLVIVASPMPSLTMARGAQAPAVAESLQDLSWLAGHWVGKTGKGAHIEEMWMPARGGLMIGSFRWEQGNGRWLFEFMSLEASAADAGRLTLRLKHFDRAFTGMEERTASTTFTSTERTPSRVVFELREDARVVRLAYVRTGPDALTVTFDETEPGKPAARIEFPYTRVR